MADSNLPIDIHTNKLLDWLISRRHCKKDFQKSLDLIRGKIKSTIQDMPSSDEVQQLLQQNVLDYYICRRIVQILKNADKDSRNIFGQYTSKRILDWQEIVKLYEKDNLFLAEDAQNLIRNVNYEVPSLKKISIKYEQQISDLERMAEQCKKQSRNYLTEYQQNIKKLGIEGENVKVELAAQLEILPSKLNELCQQLQSLISVCDYYKTFVFFITQNSIDCLPKLHYLLAKGNTTYYEYRTGQVPDVIEQINLSDFLLECVQDSSDKVNIDDDNGIDFGDFDNTSTDTPSTSNGDFVKLETDDLLVDNEINWDIDGSISVDTIEASESQLENQAKEAKGEDAQTVLLNSDFRKKFINELVEVECFLVERLHEMDSEHMLSSQLFQSAPSVLQLTTQDGLQQMLSQVVHLREAFESSALKVLYYMKESPKYIDNVCKKLNHLQILSQKAISKSEELEKKRSNLLEELSLVGPQIVALIQRTKSLQQRIEENISFKYNNRPVNIMGGVQVL